jgi:hypothetical protein
LKSDDDDERIGCIDVVCKTALAHKDIARIYTGEQKQTACDIPNANADYLPSFLPTRMFDMRSLLCGYRGGKIRKAASALHLRQCTDAKRSRCPYRLRADVCLIASNKVCRLTRIGILQRTFEVNVVEDGYRNICQLSNAGKLGSCLNKGNSVASIPWDELYSQTGPDKILGHT